MKFEDLYKQANDNIHADKNIIDAIYNAEYKKSYFGSKAASMCAAGLIIVFSLSMLPYFYHTGDEVLPEVVYNTEDSAEKEADTLVEETQNHMSYDEYARYLGWNILDCNLDIPDGMELSVPEDMQIVCDESTGEITDDVIQFVLTNPNNPYLYLGVSASLTGINVNTEDYLLSPVIINDTEVFVKKNDALTEAYAKLGDVWLYISSIDVSDEEFDAFLKSLIKK